MSKSGLVRIENESGASATTRITYADGSQIHGVSEVAIALKVDKPVEVKMTLWSLLDVRGLPSFQVTDPETGDLRQVKTIEFWDGTRREFAEVQP